MDDPITTPPLLQTGAPEYFNNNPDLDQNREILDSEGNETELLSKKMMRMPREHLAAYFQSKSDSEVLQAENHLLMEKNEELENRHQELCENMKELEVEKLIVDKMLTQAEARNIFIEKKLIKVEEKNQELLKDLEELKIARLAIKVLQKDNDEMKNQTLLKNCESIKEIEDKNQQIYKDYKELKAIQLIKDQILIEAESRIQELLKDKDQQLIRDRKLTETENRIQELLKNLDHKQAKLQESNREFLNNKEIEEQNQKIYKDQEAISQKKLAEFENKNQALLKDLEALKSANFNEKEKIKQYKKDYDEVQERNKKLLIMIEETNKMLVQSEEKNQQLRTSYNELEAVSKKKLIDVEGQKQLLLKDLEHLKAASLNDKEVMKKSQKDYDEKVVEMQERNKTLLNMFEETKKRLVQSEEKNQQLQTSYNELEAISKKKLSNLEGQNREFWKDFFDLKAASLNEKTLLNTFEETNKRLFQSEEKNQQLEATEFAIQNNFAPQRFNSVRERNHHRNMKRKLRQKRRAMENRNQSQQSHKNYKANQIESNLAENKTQTNILRENKSMIRTSTSLGRSFNQETLELNKVISPPQLEQQSQNLTALQSKFEFQQIDAQSNRNQNGQTYEELMRARRTAAVATFQNFSGVGLFSGAGLKGNIQEDICKTFNSKQANLVIQKSTLENSQTRQVGNLQDNKAGKELNKGLQNNKEENSSKGASTTLNAKRNFESVGDEFKKDNVTNQQNQWNSFNPEPLIIKKLKNN